MMLRYQVHPGNEMTTTKKKTKGKNKACAFSGMSYVVFSSVTYVFFLIKNDVLKKQLKISVDAPWVTATLKIFYWCNNRLKRV